MTGILLLISLTITVRLSLHILPNVPQVAHHVIKVDWTIRLIVINSKLSGANSFQTTVEHCFGKSGLYAISVGLKIAMNTSRLTVATRLLNGHCKL